MDIFEGIFAEADTALTRSQLEQALTDKGIKPADLSKGEYIAKGKYDTLAGKLTAAQTDLEAANAKLTGYDPEWQQKVTEATDATAAAVAAVHKDYAINAALTTSGAIYSDVVKGMIDLSTVTYADGKVTGIDEQLTALKESHPALFESDKPRFSGGSGKQQQTGGEDPVVAARYKNNPFYYG